MNLSNKKTPFIFCLLALAIVGALAHEPLLASISFLWANKGKAVKVVSHLSIECMLAPSDEEYLTKYAEEGYSNAQSMLATWYAQGWNDVPVDHSKALKWYRISAEAGARVPQFVMGTLYAPEIHSRTRGEEQSKISTAIAAEENIKLDYSEAAKWWQKAAEQGIHDAQYNLSILYRDGLGVSQDYDQAYFWASLVNGVYGPEYKEHVKKIASLLQPEQVEAINKRAAEWKPVIVEPKKTKILLNVARLMCGNRTSTGSDCRIDVRCSNKLSIGIDCTSGSSRTRYYVADRKTLEILSERDVACPVQW